MITLHHQLVKKKRTNQTKNKTETKQMTVPSIHVLAPLLTCHSTWLPDGWRACWPWPLLILLRQTSCLYFYFLYLYIVCQGQLQLDELGRCVHSNLSTAWPFLINEGWHGALYQHVIECGWVACWVLAVRKCLSSSNERSEPHDSPPMSFRDYERKLGFLDS